MLNPGDVLDNRYRIVRLLGQGGFGSVYRAWDTNLNNACALKENLETTPAAQSQFIHEAQILSRLRHPNLPLVTNYFIVPGQGQYLVMDYVEGENLQEKLDQARAPLPEKDVLRWVGQVCDALAHLHSRSPQVIHRDIKPQNIIIRGDGQAVLVDFGVAKVYDPALRTTMGARAVTPGYSPPEQYGLGQTDERSDVYALGATLYHLLAGREPVESVQRTVGITLPPPSHFNPAISPHVEASILRALELLPERRFQNAKDFKTALEKPGAATSPSRGRPRNRLVFIGLGIIGLLAGAGIVVTGILAAAGLLPTGALLTPRHTLTRTYTTATSLITPYPTPSRTPTILPAVAGTPVPTSAAVINPTTLPGLTTLAVWGRGMVNDIAPSADGKSLVLGTARGFYFYDATTLAELKFLEMDTNIVSVAVSPDGRLLLGGGWDTDARVVSSTDGSVLFLLPGHGSVVMDVAFSPDGAHAATACDDGIVRIWNMANGSLEYTLNGHAAPVRTVAFSPDGSLVVSGSQDRSVKIWDASSGVLLHTLDHEGAVNAVEFSSNGTRLATASEDGIIRIFDPVNKRLVMQSRNFNAAVLDVQFESEMVVWAALSDQTIQRWDFNGGAVQTEPSREDLRGGDPVNKLLLLPGNTRIAYLTWNGQVGVANPQTFQATPIPGHFGRVGALAFSPDGRYLAYTASSVTTYLQDVTTGQVVEEWEVNASYRPGLDFSPDGRLLAFTDAEEIVVWDLQSGMVRFTLRGHEGPVNRIDISPDGRYLVSGSDDSTLRLWDLSSGAMVYSMGQERGVANVHFSPDGSLIAGSRWDDAQLFIWRTADGAQLRVLDVVGSIFDLAFSPDGRYIAVATTSLKIYIYDPATGNRVGEIESDGNCRLISLDFSPDSALLVVGTEYAQMRFHQAGGEWKELAEVDGFHNWVDVVATSADGRYVAGGSQDGTVRIWGNR